MGLAMSRALGDTHLRGYGVTSEWDVRTLELDGPDRKVEGIVIGTDGGKSHLPFQPPGTFLAVSGHFLCILPMFPSTQSAMPY